MKLAGQSFGLLGRAWVCAGLGCLCWLGWAVLAWAGLAGLAWAGLAWQGLTGLAWLVELAGLAWAWLGLAGLAWAYFQYGNQKMIQIPLSVFPHKTFAHV